MEEGYPESSYTEDEESRNIANSIEDYGASRVLRDSIAELSPLEAWQTAAGYLSNSGYDPDLILPIKPPEP